LWGYVCRLLPAETRRSELVDEEELDEAARLELQQFDRKLLESESKRGRRKREEGG
jgi:hypothetical protein